MSAALSVLKLSVHYFWRALYNGALVVTLWTCIINYRIIVIIIIIRIRTDYSYCSQRSVAMKVFYRTLYGVRSAVLATAELLVI